MQIIDEVKLDFCDVLIKPKRSKTASRSKVDLTRSYTFLNSKQTWTGIPIIAANMSATGTIAMAKAMAKQGMTTCLHKFYDVETLVNFFQEYDSTFYTMGISEEDTNKLEQVLLQLNVPPKLICLDVANGYTEIFHDRVKRIRERFPDSIIAAGNVCTPEMVQELLISGAADIVKIGVGPGCFTGDTLVATANGLKRISEIQIGECVWTHKSRLRKVVGTSKRLTKELIVINGEKCTTNHEFYVLHKRYKDIVNNDNIDSYAEWIEAKNLTKDYYLLKIPPNVINKIGIEAGGIFEEQNSDQKS